MSPTRRSRRSALRVFIPVAVLAIGGACHSTTNSSPKATQIVINAGQNQVATAGTAVAIPPSVQILDQAFNPVAGVDVTFAVTQGGGSITGAAAVSDANGVAAVGSWTLGAVAGPNKMTASSTGLSGSPITFTATGN